jgi:hypothetical protein
MHLTKNPLQSETVFSGFLSGLTGFITLGILTFLVFASHYGYDLTDESFYVLLIQYPEVYKYTVSQFGFIYHPISNFLNNNIPNLRIFNILTTYFFSLGTLVLFYFCAIKKNSFDIRKNFIELISIAGISTSSLLYFSTFNWLPTPSYNSLNFQGILLAVAGLLLAQYSGRSLSVFGWVVMSVGGFVVFMAKPSSALLLGVACFFVLLLNKKISFTKVLTASFVLGALFGLTIYLLDDSFGDFVKRYQAGLEGGKLLAAGHDASSIWRIDFPNLSNSEWWCFAINSILIAVMVTSLRTSLWSIVAVSFVCILAFAIYAGVHYGQFTSAVFSLPYYSQLQVLSIPVGVALSVAGYWISTRAIPKFSNFSWLSVFCLLIPYIYAFGTNNNYFYSGSAVAFFWLLAAIAILVVIDSNWMRNSLLPLAFISQFVTIIFLLNAVESPYRQHSNLFNETQSVEIGSSKLKVHERIAKYFDDLKSAGLSGNLKSEDSIIDLTGCSPGIAVIIGTHNLGAPWLFGGYSGSNRMALFYLNKMPVDKVRKAWVLTEPSGKLSLNPDILSNWGLSLENDYELVGGVLAPAGYRGASEPSPQKIYRPIVSH